MSSTRPSPAETQAPAQRRARRKEARPGELLEAALALFVEKGFAATRVEEVAAHAGVSKGTLFLYFPSKEDLFKAVVRENIAGRFIEWNEEFEQFTGDTVALVRRIAKDLTILIVEHDMQVVMGLADRITVLHYGEILAEGKPAEIQENSRVLEVYLKT